MYLDYLYDFSYEELENKFGQAYLLTYLYPDLKLGKNHSPLRKDENPSFLISADSNNRIHWTDMRTKESGNLYSLIIEKEASVTDFSTSLDFINRNIRRLNITPSNKIILPNTVQKRKFKLGVLRRNWTTKDLEYWAQFGISLQTLKKYRVDPIDLIYFNPNTLDEQIVEADEFAYVFKEEKDGVVTLKVYQPYSKTLKFLSDVTEADAVWLGWDQMDKTGETLIWTKSLKDVMSIKETTGYNAVSLQSESWLPKKQVVEVLKSRFKKIFILYDNDYNSEINWGREAGKKLAEMFNLPQIEIPIRYLTKDYSSLYHKYKTTARTILKTIIK